MILLYLNMNSLMSQIAERIRKQTLLYRFILLAIAINITIIILNNDEFWFPFISNVNFAFHEAGHIFTMTWASEEVIAVAGSIFQCLIPIIFILLAIKQIYFFEAAILGVWLGTNLHYIGGYIIDSMRFDWPMSQFFGSNSTHDWNYLFSQWDILDRYEDIGTAVLTISRVISVASIIIAMLLLIWQIILKIRFKDQRINNDRNKVKIWI